MLCMSAVVAGASTHSLLHASLFVCSVQLLARLTVDCLCVGFHLNASKFAVSHVPLVAAALLHAAQMGPADLFHTMQLPVPA